MTRRALLSAAFGFLVVAFSAPAVARADDASSFVANVERYFGIKLKAKDAGPVKNGAIFQAAVADPDVFAQRTGFGLKDLKAGDEVGVVVLRVAAATQFMVTHRAGKKSKMFKLDAQGQITPEA